MCVNEETASVCVNPEVTLYRKRTVALLKKYFRMSVELGHLPSVMGTEFFRSHVTTYGTNTFEDAVIFVHDVERCMESIHRQYQMVIARLFFQQYTTEEASRLLECGLTTLVRRRDDALDALTEIFLDRKLLEPMLTLDYDELDEELDHDEVMGLPPKKGMKPVRYIHAVALQA